MVVDVDEAGGEVVVGGFGVDAGGYEAFEDGHGWMLGVGFGVGREDTRPVVTIKQFDQKYPINESWLEQERGFYAARLIDQDLLDRAVVVVDYEVILQAFCVPAGGNRRGGDVGFLRSPGGAEKIIETLREVPGFPNPRLDDKGWVIWGDEPPPLTEWRTFTDRLREEWQYGQYLGYSLPSIVWHLGRLAAMEAAPDFLDRERSETGGGQIRDFPAAEAIL